MGLLSFYHQQFGVLKKEEREADACAAHILIPEEELEKVGEIEPAEARIVKLGRMEKSLQQLMLEKEITLANFKEHRIKIEAERARLQNVVDTISQRQHLIKADFEVALQLATELDFLFEKGTFDEKRLLCETVFKRVYLKEGRVSEVELNAPFGLIASRGKSSGTVLNGWALWTHIELFKT